MGPLTAITNVTTRHDCRWRFLTGKVPPEPRSRNTHRLGGSGETSPSPKTGSPGKTCAALHFPSDQLFVDFKGFS